MNDTESLVLPENLFPREHVFTTKKVDINFLSDKVDRLMLETVGWQQLDVELARQKGGFEEMNDYRYALRDIKQDKTTGKVRANIVGTTMGLYNRFHVAGSQEDLRNLELSMPVGGCVIVLTTEKDGSHRLMLQYRIHKDEYSYTPGASAGGIIKMQYTDSGQPLPIEQVYQKHIAIRLEEELGIEEDEFDLGILALITEKEPKAHQEIASLAISHLSEEEITHNYSARKGTVTSPRHLISLPADPETIEMLVSGIACPMPPSHVGAFIAVGHMLKMAVDGTEAADGWLKKMEEKVDSNNEKIDYIVRNSGRGSQYLPYYSPAAQGLPDLLMAFWEAGLLQPVKRIKEANTPKEIVEPGDACITGSVHFPKYGNDASDTQRGNLALKSIKESLQAGYNMAIVVSPVTDGSYKQALEDLKSAGYRGKLLLLPEEGRTYSGARRQSMRESLKQLHPKYILSCEIEKRELIKFYQDFMRRFTSNTPAAIVVMDRGIFEKNPNLPWAQDWGEMHQNRAIMRHITQAGLLPEDTNPLDLLNGTRFVLNQEVETSTGKINPTSVMQLTYEYTGEQPDFAYGVDHYSAAVYHSVTMAIALGLKVEQVRVPYVHDEKQRQLEEGDQKEMFEKKRENQARAIIDQNFDLVANIINWKKEGLWPEVVSDAIRNNTSVKLKHFDSRKYKIDKGELISLG